MSEHRMSKGETEHYTSFEDLAKAFGRKPITKQTKDKNKLNEQRNAFCGKHKCRVCGQPMTWITGTSTMTCLNPSCKGQKHEIKNEETGESKIWYTPSYDLLDSKGLDIAENIFAEL